MKTDETIIVILYFVVLVAAAIFYNLYKHERRNNKKLSEELKTARTQYDLECEVHKEDVENLKGILDNYSTAVKKCKFGTDCPIYYPWLKGDRK